ncbi:hypothetical protein LPJ59_003401 [Coemansia sp. RSA 2399]|nr:hypothetical protein LPJ59_003401 [Coemansia sp. RSA 2399]KAJ1903468.1 hypothetical protein LPJ81_003040 [Coemansia sp. IMI 209127]
MPVDRLRLTFETVGKVWDVIPVEKKTSGATLTQALVRFYDGDYTPGASPSDPPLSLPRPIASEVNTVRGYVNAAVERFNMSIFNGKEIHVCQYYDSSPTQLHKWYEDMRIAEAEQNSSLVLQNAGIFPINPFYAPSENTNDYQKGFEEGFKLGMKDGLKDVR